MLDLVKQETERIESRFLEPACGTGNFLTEILERKLRVVEARYGKSQLEYERNAVLAVSSIYGIDILDDNIVFTVEPGIYFPKKFGIRIEDTVALIDEKIDYENPRTKDRLKWIAAISKVPIFSGRMPSHMPRR